MQSSLCMKTAISALLLLGIGWTTVSSTSGTAGRGRCGPASSSELNLTEYKVKRVSTYLEYVHNETYVGAPKREETGTPPYSQRTAFLYFFRKQIGDPLAWMLLALGEVANRGKYLNDKKKSVQLWEAENPHLFSKLEEYLPRMWTDAEAFVKDMDEDKMYVYKPTNANMGDGIRFVQGTELSELVADLENTPGPASKWIMQAFVNPYLYEGRKTHFRALTLIIVQPSGKREFFQFKLMKIFSAAEQFDQQRLIHDKDAAAGMLLTNMHQSRAWVRERRPEEKYDHKKYIVDAEGAFTSSDSGVEFEDVYNEIKNIHVILYSIIGHRLECKATDVSIYDNACFHIIASDIAVDNEGKPYFLEGNTGMGIGFWSLREIRAFADGAASHIEVPETPFKMGKSPLWDKLDILV